MSSQGASSSASGDTESGAGTVSASTSRSKIIIRVISFTAYSRELVVDLVKDHDMDEGEVIYKAPKEGTIL